MYRHHKWIIMNQLGCTGWQLLSIGSCNGAVSVELRESSREPTQTQEFTIELIAHKFWKLVDEHTVIHCIFSWSQIMFKPRVLFLLWFLIWAQQLPCHKDKIFICFCACRCTGSLWSLDCAARRVSWRPMELGCCHLLVNLRWVASVNLVIVVVAGVSACK